MGQRYACVLNYYNLEPWGNIQDKTTVQLIGPEITGEENGLPSFGQIDKGWTDFLNGSVKYCKGRE